MPLNSIYKMLFSSSSGIFLYCRQPVLSFCLYHGLFRDNHSGVLKTRPTECWLHQRFHYHCPALHGIQYTYRNNYSMMYHIRTGVETISASVFVLTVSLFSNNFFTPLLVLVVRLKVHRLLFPQCCHGSAPPIQPGMHQKPSVG